MNLFRALFVLVVATLLSGCGYNQIQTLDEGVKAAWSEVLSQYQRRADLVPQLVSSVDAYMTHEKEVLTQVTQARARVGSLQVSPDRLPTEEEMQQFQAAQSQMTSALSRLLAVSENYPDLKASTLFSDLNVQLEGTENRIATARTRYIRSVQEYNTYIRQFPQVVVARIFGYSVKPNFGVENEAEIKKAPTIKFSNSPASVQ